ncbi:thioesterase II family protein [Amycolatopsis pithecellobii]|uniref:thioesterase II family protein n=1 Tax=Amycolatopsis pithecellobii TaxID=664692 RepID=UPI001409853F|nr:alpha/beta fold hydrolase [Amycolatopsis pithecellobii]
MQHHRTVPRTAYLASTPSGKDRVRLFCFHHAGGGASAFAGFERALADRIDVVRVQLPGREGRIGQRLPPRMADIVTELDAHLDPYLTGDYAFYGHSMGALVAHDLAARRQARGANLPSRLIAAACRAPHLPPAFAALHDGTDEVLIRTMTDIGGLSPALLGRPEWVRAAVSLTRGDLRLCAGRDTTPGEPLRCAIDVFHGEDDPLVSAGQARGWARRTAGAFGWHTFEGGHFFQLGPAADVVARAIARLLVKAALPGVR